MLHDDVVIDDDDVVIDDDDALVVHAQPTRCSGAVDIPATNHWICTSQPSLCFVLCPLSNCATHNWDQFPLAQGTSKGKPM